MVLKLYYVLPLMITHYERKMIYMMLMPRRKGSFDLFDDFFKDDDFFSQRTNALMKTDIKEKKDKFVIEMDLPGYNKDNINIELNNGYLTISANVSKENNEGDDEKYVRQERFFGECSRSFYVGDEVEKEDIEAEFKNGILKIDIPKKEEKKIETTKKIEIK